MRFYKHKQSQAPLTVANLNRQVAHSLVGRSRVRLAAFNGRAKRFFQDYRLPSVVTMVFIALVLALGTVRQFEKTSLIALINQVTEGGGGYSTLLSADQRDAFVRDDTVDNEGQNQQDTTNTNTTTTDSTQSTSTSFSLDGGSGSGGPPQNSGGGTSGGSSGGGGSSSGGGTPPAEPEPFDAAIESFGQTGSSLQCTNPSKPSKGSCSKFYVFRASVKTINGPGNVSYSWQSDIVIGTGIGNYSAGSGSAITALSKEVTLACTKPATFNMQFALITPAFSSSNSLTIDHVCNEL